jgi:NhaP-type Na+/H+ or K+/H+ antiporter
VLANVVGWVLGAVLSQLVLGALFGNNPGSPLAFTVVNMAVTGLVAGLITGLALVWIVREPEQPIYTETVEVEDVR